MSLLLILILIFACFLGLPLLYLFLIMPALGKKADVPELRQYYYAHRGLHDVTPELPSRKRIFPESRDTQASSGSSRRPVSAPFHPVPGTNAPENSLPAFRAAAEAGYGIELDVQLTKDGIPVVFHDFTLDRVCGVSGKVCRFTWEELSAFRLNGTDERIPKFEEVLETVNGRVPLLIEYKVELFDTSVCRVCDRLLKHYPGLYCIESFNPLVLRWYKKNRPQIVRGQLSAKFRDVYSPFHYVYLSPLHHLLFNFLTKPDFIAYDFTCAGALSRRLCRNLYRNLSVAWTIRSKEDMEACKKQFDLFIFEGFRP